MEQSKSVVVAAALLCLAAPVHAQAPAWKDPSPHRVQMVSVDKGVELEVLDWGGRGRPLVLLAGGGFTAHVYDEFALRFTAHNHVYGITRRGFGASTYSAEGYGADRAGDDVLAVLDALRLQHPVLVGHSLAGEEMSSIASRYPRRVAGLVYLDAAYPYAFDNGTGPAFDEFMKIHGPPTPEPKGADLASFAALQAFDERIDGFRFPEAELRQQWEAAADGKPAKQRDLPGYATLMQGMKKFSRIPVPALMIFANPHSQGPWVEKNTDASVRAAAEQYATSLSDLVGRQIKSVKEGMPTAQVVILPGAHHFVFLSNQDEVVKKMRGFLAGLR